MKDQTLKINEILGLDYYDGPLNGILKCDNNDVYKFQMISDESKKERLYEFYQFNLDKYEKIYKLLSKYIEPIYPIWVPEWSFGDQKIRDQVSKEIDELLGIEKDIEWLIVTDDLLEGHIFSRKYNGEYNLLLESLKVELEDNNIETQFLNSLYKS